MPPNIHAPDLGGDEFDEPPHEVVLVALFVEIEHLDIAWSPLQKPADHEDDPDHRKFDALINASFHLSPPSWLPQSEHRS